MKKGLFLCIALALGWPAWAAPQAVVDAVQAPAWRDRDGRAEALAPGMEVQSRDRIRTGEGSRVYLRLADGSTVKLGENGTLLAERLGPGDSKFFSAALDVAKGAFRFTTDKLRKLSQRDVTIRVATVTAGIRGTDIWGKTEPERDFVCLLEGRITVSHKDGDTREMNEALTFYVAPRNQPPKGVEAADPETVRKWAAETEIAAGQGAARRQMESAARRGGQPGGRPRPARPCGPGRLCRDDPSPQQRGRLSLQGVRRPVAEQG